MAIPLTGAFRAFIMEKTQKWGEPLIQELYLYQSTSFDPYYNLAVEKQLLERVSPGECILYLWQNQNTVVIGKNQNAWAECRTSLLGAEGGHLARRLSGGGAVFHDLGNLNFTFLVRDEDYDVDRQLSVIQEAVRLAGVQTERSGRNDILAEGRKFSGNAFYHQGGHAYHHGTLMVDVDKDKLQRYLSPSKAKLEAKGVASVRSRVVNLKELSPALTVEKLKEYMVRGFETVYGLQCAPILLTDKELGQIKESAKINASWDFLYGTRLPFTFECEGRFPWGGIQMQLQAKGGIITAVKVYSDAMDWQLAPTLEKALTGCWFSLDAMTAALIAALGDSDTCRELCQMLRNQQI